MDKNKQLEDLCLSIFAHSNNDYEVTLSGNGTNASEASNVALSERSVLSARAMMSRRLVRGFMGRPRRALETALELCRPRPPAVAGGARRALAQERPRSVRPRPA